MSSRFTVRTAALASGVVTASVALLAGTLTPVQAAAFTHLELDPYAGSYLSTGDCTQTSPSVVSPGNLPIVPNGAAVTQTTSASGAFKSNTDATDTISQTASLSAKAKATAVGDRPTSLSLTATGTATTTSSKPMSGCTGNTSVGTDAEFGFELTVPTWVTYSMSRKGPMYTEVYVETTDGDPYVDHYGREIDGSSNGRYLLAPGTYGGYLEADIRARGNTAFTRNGSASLSLTFAPAGSASAKPAGKAKPYVSLPAARSCTTHDAKAKVTSNAKRAKKISSVVYKVNGKKVATLKGKAVKKAKVTSLKVADSKAAKVEALVTLKNGKKLTTKAAYLACSA